MPKKMLTCQMQKTTAAAAVNASDRQSANLATTKYRRLKTLIKKTVEISQKCGISLNLLVKDNKFSKITEYHTNDSRMTL